MLLFLTGVGPLIAWRKIDARRTCAISSCARSGSAWSPAACVLALGVPLWAVGPVLRAVRVRDGTIAQEFCARRARSPGAHRHDFFTALVGLVGAQQAALRRLHRPPRHRADVPRLRRATASSRGAGAAEDGPGRRGRQVRAEARALKATDDGQKQMITAQLTVSRTARCSTSCSRPSGSTAITRASRRPRWRSDAARPRTSTSCSPASTRAGSRRRCTLVVNPLVNWIWLGFRVLAFGTAHRAAAREGVRGGPRHMSPKAR